MASVALRFSPPNAENVTKLHIWEASTADGPFTEIEVVTSVGSYPDYIDNYTTDLAASITDYFAIQWEDSKGAKSDLSAPMKGNTTSLVGVVVERMMLRDPALTEIIAVQEAEAAVADYYHTIDVYSIDASLVSPKVISGLTNLALARSYITAQITNSATAGSKWTAGIVSMDSSSSSTSTKSIDAIKALIDLANKDLGLRYSVVLLMEEISVGDGVKQLQGMDLSRLIYEIQ